MRETGYPDAGGHYNILVDIDGIERHLPASCIFKFIHPP